jgi:cerevisin
VSHRSKLTLGTFTRYEHDPSGGKGVDVYVIDTGINIYHTEFEGRAEWGRTIPENEANVDGNGHGTHCAGTIASRKYGVAKAAKVIAVKVLGSDGSGTMSDVLAGVNYVVSSALTKAARGDTGHKGSIINMSLGGGKSRALDEAMNIAVAVGIHVAVAAGAALPRLTLAFTHCPQGTTTATPATIPRPARRRSSLSARRPSGTSGRISPITGSASTCSPPA